MCASRWSIGSDVKSSSAEAPGPSIAFAEPTSECQDANARLTRADCGTLVHCELQGGRAWQSDHIVIGYTNPSPDRFCNKQMTTHSQGSPPAVSAGLLQFAYTMSPSATAAARGVIRSTPNMALRRPLLSSSAAALGQSARARAGALTHAGTSPRGELTLTGHVVQPQHQRHHQPTPPTLHDSTGRRSSACESLNVASPSSRPFQRQ